MFSRTLEAILQLVKLLPSITEGLFICVSAHRSWCDFMYIFHMWITRGVALLPVRTGDTQRRASHSQPSYCALVGCRNLCNFSFTLCVQYEEVVQKTSWCSSPPHPREMTKARESNTLWMPANNLTANPPSGSQTSPVLAHWFSLEGQGCQSPGRAVFS